MSINEYGVRNLVNSLVSPTNCSSFVRFTGTNVTPKRDYVGSVLYSYPSSLVPQRTGNKTYQPGDFRESGSGGTGYETIVTDD